MLLRRLVSDESQLTMTVIRADVRLILGSFMEANKTV